MPAVKIVGLTKVFKSGVRRKRTVALDNLNLEVKEGEILGYLGPNGAGKTTTFKILMGLLRPTKGDAWLLGKNIKDISSREEVGFLPEQPYFYDYLTAWELLDLYGQFYNLSKRKRRTRVRELLELVGLQDAATIQLRKFSRGMLQRVGVAQALINDPKLILLDEPLSALDPIGRKQMRDIILRLKSEGKTVIYSSHILSDVEAICDRVAILSQGRLLGVGQLSELLGAGEQLMEINIEGLDEEGKAEIKQLALENIVERGARIIVNVSTEEMAQKVLEIIVQHGAKLISLIPRMESLEDIFLKRLKTGIEGRESRDES